VEALAFKVGIVAGKHSLANTQYNRQNLPGIFANCHAYVHRHLLYHQFPEYEVPVKPSTSIELLFFGFVRPYKGLELLLHTMSLLKACNLDLTIAGEFWGGLHPTRDLISDLGVSGAVELRPWFRTEADASMLFSRAEAVVVPYRR
jgi:glycosyltransferase involved in cell wall biosynthesis